MDKPLPHTVTLDLNNGDIVVTVEIANGAHNGGHGIIRFEVNTTTPVVPDFLQTFLEAAVGIALGGGIAELVARHDAEAD